MTFSEKIREYVCLHIETGAWPIGFQIPPEREFMEKFSVSRMTANRVLKELAIEGIIYRKKGRGSFVQGKIPREKLLEIHDIEEEIKNRDSSYFREVKYLAEESDSPLISHIFGKDHSQHIFRSKIVHYENEIPLQLEDRYVNSLVAPHYLDIDFSKISTYNYLNGVAPLQKAEHELTAIIPNLETRKLLQILPSEPCLLLKRKTWFRNLLVSYAELTYPGNHYSFGGTWMIQND